MSEKSSKTAADRYASALDLPLNRGARVLMEASAGSGKTRAITSLIARLLVESELPIESVLVVTFTRAATAELRERIRRLLHDILPSLAEGNIRSKEPTNDQAAEIVSCWKENFEGFDPGSARKKIRRAIDDIDLAPVYTIHGFCQRTLSDFAFECDFPFDTEIVGQDDSMIHEAVRDFWRRRLRDIAPVQAAFVNDRQFLPAPVAKWVDRWRGKAIDIEWDEGDLSDDALQGAIECWNEKTNEMRTIWKRCGDAYEYELREGGWLNRNAYRLPTIDDKLSELKERYLGEGLMLLPKKAQKDKTGLFEFLGHARLEEKSRKNESLPQDPSFIEMAKCFDALNEACESLVGTLEQWLRSLRKDLLEEIPRTIRERIRALKKCSYDDLLVEIDNALGGANGHRLSMRLRERYQVALIDEYQDTDQIQARIFDRIFGDDPQENDCASLNPLFMVGDPKQSIYRFRGADVFAYLEAKTKAGLKVSLEENWRSTPELVKAMNALFDRPCAFALPDRHIEYNKVKAGKDDRPLIIEGRADHAPLCLRLLPASEQKSKNKEVAGEEAVEGMVREIAYLLGAEKTRLHQEGKEPRALRGSDITVLVRKKHQGRLVAVEMRRRGIGCIEIGDDSVFRSREAQQLERLLWALIEAGSESRVRGALAGDLFGLNTEDIRRFESCEDRWNDWSQRLRDWRETWERDGIGVMLRKLIKRQQGAAMLLKSQEGPRRLTNLLHLSDLLQDAQTRFRFTPSLLAKWLSDRLEDKNTAVDEIQLRLPSDEDLVRILTVHGSKGLEFPIVFHPFAWDGSDYSKRLNAKKNEGVACHLRKPNAKGDEYSQALYLDPDEDILECDRIEEFSEELRLLYVALTRAQYRCVVTWGKVGGAKDTPLAWLLHRGADDEAAMAGIEPGDEDANRKRDPKAARDRDEGNESEDDERIVTRTLRASIKATTERFESLDHSRWRDEVDALHRLCPHGIEVTDLFEGGAAIGAEIADDADKKDMLSVREFTCPIRPSRQIASYSALIGDRGATGSTLFETERPDHDDFDIESASEEEAGDTPSPSSDTTDPLDQAIKDLPKGAMTGRCLHRIFERLDRKESGDGEGNVDAICKQEIRNSGLDEKWLDAVRTMIERTRAICLQEAEGEGFRLRDPVRRAVEMEFQFPLVDARIDHIARCLIDHGYPGTLKNPFRGKKTLDGDEPASIQGYMRGFIDLVVEHEGRWYVLDYKSNRLQAYDRESMAREMKGHDYHLQYLIYLVALHRYLAFRLEGYDPERHIGGAFYLFLRGIDPEKATNEGIFHDRPPTRCLLALDRCFEGGGPR